MEIILFIVSAFVAWRFLLPLAIAISSEALGSLSSYVWILVAVAASVGAWLLVLKRHAQLGNLLFVSCALLSGLGGLHVFGMFHAQCAFQPAAPSGYFGSQKSVGKLACSACLPYADSYHFDINHQMTP